MSEKNNELSTQIVEALLAVEATKSKKTSKKKGSTKKLDLSKQVRAWQIMLYCDQIGHRNEDLTEDEQEQILKDFLNGITFKDGLFYGIVHTKELTTKVDDSDYTEVSEKKHIHLVFYTSNQIRPFTILKSLGIQIIKDDENLYSHGGFSYLNIKKHEVAKAVLYLNHNTEKAILDNKPSYNISDIVTNDTEPDWYHKYSDEYTRYCEGLYVNKYGQVQTLNEEDKLFDILDEAYEIGYSFGDLDSYIDEIPRRYKYKYYSKIEDSYYRGVHKRFTNKDTLDVHRCSVFIYGPSDTGKTYASVHSLLELGRRVYQVGQSSGTGGEDNIKPGDCLVYDDRVPKNCLDKADTNVCELYRRNSNNGVFAGDYFIINYNRPFDEVFKNYYKTDDDSEGLSEEAKALKTRFYIVEVDINGHYTVHQKGERGTQEDCAIRDKKFNDFMNHFNKHFTEFYEKRQKKSKVEPVDEYAEF